MVDEHRPHALVAGGTGMLRGVVLALAAEGWTVSVVARNRTRLHRLHKEAAARGGIVTTIAVDWRDDQALRLGLENALAQHGPPSLAVCWIHSDAPRAPLVVARCLAAPMVVARYLAGPHHPPCRFFHLRGSASSDPSSAPEDWRERIEALGPALLYRRIVLGFVIEAGRSRWLTDEEICDGVLQAIRDDASDSIIGTVEPWSSRP